MFGKKLFKIRKTLKPVELTRDFPALVDELLREVEPRIYTEHSLSNPYKLECDAYTKLKSVPAAQKPDLLIYLLDIFTYWESKALLVRAKNDCLQMHSEEKKCLILEWLQIKFAQTRMSFAPGKFRELCDQIAKVKNQWNAGELFGLTVIQLKAMGKREGLSEELKYEIASVLKALKALFFYADDWKAEAHLCQLISSKHVTAPFSFGNDRISQILTTFLQEQPKNEQNYWQQFFNLCSITKTLTPSSSWLKDATRLLNAIGWDKFQKTTNSWIAMVSQLDVLSEFRPLDEEDPEQLSAYLNFIEPKLFSILQGICWSQVLFADTNTQTVLTQLAEKCFRSLPATGPCAGPVGNAAIFALANSDTFSSLLSLASLKSYIKQRKTQKLIDTYVQRETEKYGLSLSEIEERAVPDFGLVEGKRIEVFSGFNFVITYSNTGRVKTHWIGSEGKTQHNPPGFVAQDPILSRKFNHASDLVNQIRQASEIQKERISNLTQQHMSWSLAELEKLYINHGLICSLARNLIWLIEDKPVLWVSGQWQQVDGKDVIFSAHARIQLWRPED
ncbi:DUF4132 domain-containing protein [Pseudovibrio ascidiaceicola]|uniref:DUF4132 domain-containing protein n=1 Tax=Pseudovibrio ascidiaceicola TaxID=285279 RepID=UPI003D35BA27